MLRRFILPLLLLLAAADSSRAAEPQNIRVLTFNLRYITPGDHGTRMWSERRDAVGQLIASDGADFLCVQEAFRSMLDDIHARVPDYGEVGVGREDGKTQGEYSAILFRKELWELRQSGTFWLSATPDLPASCSWGNHVTRICTWAEFRHKISGKELFVFNSHFDHESQPAREHSAALVLQRINSRSPQLPVIFTGDLNTTPDNTAIATILQGPPTLAEAWASLHHDVTADKAGTFHDFTGSTGGPHIDYIFSSPGLKTSSCEIIHTHDEGRYPSDHFPVRATLLLE